MVYSVSLKCDDDFSTGGTLFLRMRVTYSEAPFPETLEDDPILGPDFITFEPTAEVVTLGPALTPVDTLYFRYGLFNDPEEPSDWVNGDPDGDWLGSDYYRLDVVSVTSSPPPPGAANLTDIDDTRPSIVWGAASVTAEEYSAIFAGASIKSICASNALGGSLGVYEIREAVLPVANVVLETVTDSLTAVYSAFDSLVDAAIGDGTVVTDAFRDRMQRETERDVSNVPVRSEDDTSEDEASPGANSFYTLVRSMAGELLALTGTETAFYQQKRLFELNEALGTNGSPENPLTDDERASLEQERLERLEALKTDFGTADHVSLGVRGVTGYDAGIPAAELEAAAFIADTLVQGEILVARINEDSTLSFDALWPEVIGGTVTLDGDRAIAVASEGEDRIKLANDTPGQIQLLGGEDWFEGGDANDAVDGGAENDTLLGGAGDDTLTGGVGNDTLNGELGTDYARIDVQSDTATVERTQDGILVTSSEGTDLLVDIEHIIFSDQSINVQELVPSTPVGSVVINGNLQQGQTLTADVTGIGGEDGTASVAYQWLRDGAEIRDAEESTYELTQEDVGKAISVQVDYTYAGGTNEQVMSAATGPVANTNDEPIGTVSILGTPALGAALTAETGSIADADGLGAFRFQWLADGVPIEAATAASFTPSEAQLGAALSVTVSYTDGFGTPESLTSAVTGASAPGGERLGSSGPDALLGGPGNDMVQGFNGFDTLNGDAGNDTLQGNFGNDELNGGDGDDELQGGIGFDVMRGDAGNDLLVGRDGFDTLEGGTGNDTLRGNAGNDVMSGGDDDDLLVGGIGSDVMGGDAGNDLLQGQGGFDTLNGGDGADTLQGNNSDDLLNGGDGDDLLEGGLANDVLNGDAGNDRLEGANGFDLLNGGAGDDRLEGNAGNDTLDGGTGNDVLRGGLGADTFVFRVGSGNDRIADLGIVDSVELDAALLGGGTPDVQDLRDISTLDADGFLLLDFGNGDTLTFTDITNTSAILGDVSFI